MAAAAARRGFGQSWNVAFGILNMCLISAIMALGVNMQWGYAGLFNVGIMGFTALGGLTAVLISMPPVPEAWAAGGGASAYRFCCWSPPWRRPCSPAGWSLLPEDAGHRDAHHCRILPDPRVSAGGGPYRGGESGPDRISRGPGLPILLSWAAGGLVAAGAAWFIGKVALGLRADYLAIATLGISEIIIAIVKYEDWLTRGVKNVTGLPRPVPYEVELVQTPWFIDLASWLGATDLSSGGRVRQAELCGPVPDRAGRHFLVRRARPEVPLGPNDARHPRQSRGRRAMGKDVTGATSRYSSSAAPPAASPAPCSPPSTDSTRPPATSRLRYTFLIWVMVILGGSGNNWGAVLGGFIIWFLWIQAEPLGNWFMQTITLPLERGLLAQGPPDFRSSLHALPADGGDTAAGDALRAPRTDSRRSPRHWISPGARTVRSSQRL
jgi:branched-chain amino acid transport system permease protein